MAAITLASLRSINDDDCGATPLRLVVPDKRAPGIGPIRSVNCVGFSCANGRLALGTTLPMLPINADIAAAIDRQLDDSSMDSYQRYRVMQTRLRALKSACSLAGIKVDRPVIPQHPVMTLRALISETHDLPGELGVGLSLTPVIDITSAHLGFDWDHGTLILTADPLTTSFSREELDHLLSLDNNAEPSSRGAYAAIVSARIALAECDRYESALKGHSAAQAQ